jgi:hypothetical protein
MGLAELLMHWHVSLYWIAGFIVITGGLIIFLGDGDLFANKKLRFSDIDAHVLRETNRSGPYGDYSLKHFNGEYFIYCQEVNSLLGSRPAKLSYNSSKFILDETLRKLAPAVLKQFSLPSDRRIFDNHLRLQSDIIPGALLNGTGINVQTTDYFAGICSNKIALKEIWIEEQEQLIHNGLNLFIDHNLLINLQDSPCANIIGINTLLFTADGKVVVIAKDDSYARDNGSLFPTVSASLNTESYRDQPTLQGLLVDGLHDELSKDFNLPVESLQTFIVGYTRWLNRAGKPEFFAITRTTARSSDLRTNRQIFMPFMNITLFNRSTEEFNGMLNLMLEKEEDNFSALLFINIFYLVRQLSFSSELRKFLGFK